MYAGVLDSFSAGPGVPKASLGQTSNEEGSQAAGGSQFLSVHVSLIPAAAAYAGARTELLKPVQLSMA